MVLTDLLATPNSDLTDEELERKISVLRKLRVFQTEEIETEDGVDEDGEPIIHTTKVRKAKAIKSNKARRINDLLTGMSAEDQKDFLRLIAERKANG